MIAFIDESVRAGSGGLLYVVAAGAVVQADLDPARDGFRKLLLPRQPYLHWNSEKPARRVVVLDRLTGMDAMALACSYYPGQTPLSRVGEGAQAGRAMSRQTSPANSCRILSRIA